MSKPEPIKPELVCRCGLTKNITGNCPQCDLHLVRTNEPNERKARP